MGRTDLKERIRAYFATYGVEIAGSIAMMYGNSNWYKIYLMLKE
ncbi:hypothetical protein [Petralouisia muris]|nr:hypothetical protein [Petralouisia muris]